MSLLIPGMKLDGRPHKALLTERDGKPVLVVETQYSYADNEVKVYPVEEIPPHGRLIDADELAEDLDFDIENDLRALDDLDIVGKKRAHIQFDKDCKQNCMNYLSNCPTIIPAEEVPGHE